MELFSVIDFEKIDLRQMRPCESIVGILSSFKMLVYLLFLFTVSNESIPSPLLPSAVCIHTFCSTTVNPATPGNNSCLFLLKQTS